MDVRGGTDASGQGAPVVGPSEVGPGEERQEASELVRNLSQEAFGDSCCDRNPYLTDASRYRLSSDEAARRQRERERGREATRLRRHVRYAARPRQPKSEEADASQLITESEAQASRSASVDSLAVRVWGLEDALDEAVAANVDLGRRVTELTRTVADLRQRLEAAEAAAKEPQAPAPVTPPPDDPPERTASNGRKKETEDDVSVDLKWTLDAVDRVLRDEPPRGDAKHVEWRHTARLW